MLTSQGSQMPSGEPWLYHTTTRRLSFWWGHSVYVCGSLQFQWCRKQIDVLYQTNVLILLIDIKPSSHLKILLISWSVNIAFLLDVRHRRRPRAEQRYGLYIIYDVALMGSLWKKLFISQRFNLIRKPTQLILEALFSEKIWWTGYCWIVWGTRVQRDEGQYRRGSPRLQTCE